MDPFKLNINETTRFLLPMVLPNITHNELISNYFQQAYIGILDEKEYDDQLLLQFTEDFDENSLDEIGITEYFKISDNLIRIFLPEVEEFLEQYELFLAGNYSKLNEKSKQDILEYWGEDELSILHGILYKTEVGLEILSKLVDKNTIKSIKENPDSEYWPAPDVLINELLYDGF